MIQICFYIYYRLQGELPPQPPKIQLSHHIEWKVLLRNKNSW